MKRPFLSLALLALLVGCNNSSLPSSSGEPSSLDPTTSETTPSSGENPSTTEEPPSSEDNPSSEVPPSSEDATIHHDLGEIRSYVLNANWVPNDVGVYTSTERAEFTAQLLTVQDYITSKSGYNSQYRVFVANETGYISVAIDANAYTNIKKYHADQQVYIFKGYLGLYNGEVEIDMTNDGRPFYLEDVTLDYDYKSFAIDGGNILDLKSRVKARAHNGKGVNWSNEIYKYRLKYVTKVENAVALFSDGHNVILMHSHDKVNNGFSLNSTYDIYAREGLFRFTPEIEYIGHTKVTDEVTLDYEAMATSLTSEELYKHKYEVDKPSALSANMRFTDLLVNLYYFEGYVNSYLKNGAEYIVFDDVEKDVAYGTYTQAVSAKAMFANNDNSVKLLYDNDYAACPFIDYLYADEDGNYPKIGFFFAAYAYNTQGYWQVQVLEDTIVTLS